MSSRTGSFGLSPTGSRARRGRGRARPPAVRGRRRPLEHPDVGLNLVFLRTGLATFKPEAIAGAAGQGTLLVFVVNDLDAEFARIAALGARVVTPPETEPWGERFCQFADDNGLIWQLVRWMSEPDAARRRPRRSSSALRLRGLAADQDDPRRR
ncbi:VOC family protein [Mumia sp. ZJ1417]|nr:VOC family protein [Mumia sp. ZJ1417]